ncbi:hypothetical protein HS088_TW15G00840 [Tripterygium wilfordii]|uniref:Uncharacterized protein n=1 Tax=Tripterygium wilfordii TaxID=458696 RepID=A0A7J7CMW3_TRIWF|nr:hypothetical protein HS088_TW15G00840 [Tripterygium wilfordii]
MCVLKVADNKDSGGFYGGGGGDEHKQQHEWPIPPPLYSEQTSGGEMSSLSSAVTYGGPWGLGNVHVRPSFGSSSSTYSGSSSSGSIWIGQKRGREEAEDVATTHHQHHDQLIGSVVPPGVYAGFRDFQSSSSTVSSSLSG